MQSPSLRHSGCCEQPVGVSQRATRHKQKSWNTKNKRFIDTFHPGRNLRRTWLRYQLSHRSHRLFHCRFPAEHHSSTRWKGTFHTELVGNPKFWCRLHDIADQSTSVRSSSRSLCYTSSLASLERKEQSKPWSACSKVRSTRRGEDRGCSEVS